MADAFSALTAAKKIKSHINYTKPSKLLTEDPRIDAVKRKIKACYAGTDGVEWLKSLRKYDQENTGVINLEDFVQAVRRGQASGSDEIPYSELKAIFFRVDKNGTGRLGYDTEFAEFMGIFLDTESDDWIHARKTEKQLTSARAANKATYGEGLVTQIKRKLKAQSYRAGKLDMEKLHRFYDRDNTGCMEFEEFKRAVRRDGNVTEAMLSDAGVRRVFRQMDKDDSGSIGFDEEFLPWLTSHDDYKPPHLDSPEHTSYFHIKRKEEREEQELDMFEHARRMAKQHCYRLGNLSYQRFFAKWDKDGQGEIDFEEFRLVLRRDAKLSKFELPDDKLLKLFKQIERDGGGTIDLKEFTAWLEDTSRYFPTRLRGDHGRGEQLMIEKHKLESCKKKHVFETMREVIKTQFIAAGYSAGEFSLHKAFRAYDKDKDGNVTFEEFRRCVRKEAKITLDQFTDQGLRNLFNQIDRDKNGTIAIDEFDEWLDNFERYSNRFARSKTPPKSRDERRTAMYREGREGVRRPISINVPKNRSRPTTPTSERPARSVSSPSESNDPPINAFDAQIDRLMGLVRVQTEEVTRMRADHAENLAQLRAEYDALVACLDASGVIAVETVNAELEEQFKRNQNLSQRQPTFTNPSSSGSRIASPLTSPNATIRVGRSPASGSPQTMDSTDLYEVAKPLLQPYPKKKEVDQALAQIDKLLDDPTISPNEWTGIGTPLHAAERVGDVTFAHLLLDKLADVNIVDDNCVSVLEQACYDGRTEMVKLLLERLADPNQADKHDQTPLFFAPSRNVCEALYAAHADINATNVKGQSALHLAAWGGLDDVLCWMARHACRSLLDMRDVDGFTAVEYAEQAGIRPVMLNRLKVWEPRLVNRKEELNREEINESDMERRRRLWEIAHREEQRRKAELQNTAEDVDAEGESVESENQTTLKFPPEDLDAVREESEDQTTLNLSPEPFEMGPETNED